MDNFSDGVPPDLRRYANSAYQSNVSRFLLAYQKCLQPDYRDAVVRSLDWGRRGVSDSGLGRAEAVRFGHTNQEQNQGEAAAVPELLPRHIHGAILSKVAKDGELGSFMEAITQHSHSDVFHIRRLYELCEEKEIAYEGRLEKMDGQAQGTRIPDGLSEKPADRGRFPYVDEKASLIDELKLRDILKLRHKTNSRHHPKWKEVRYWFKKWQQQYLRRRHMQSPNSNLALGEQQRMLSLKSLTT